MRARTATSIYVIALVAFLFAFQAYSQTTVNYSCYPLDNIHANDHLKGIWKDDVGYVWLASDWGVLKYNGAQTRTYSEGLGSLYTKKFSRLKDGRLIVVTDAGLHVVTPGLDSVRFQPLTLGEYHLSDDIVYPKSAFVDSRGVIWIGESDAIVRVDSAGFDRYSFESNYSYHRSFVFTEDVFGNIWAASFSGHFLVWDASSRAFREVNIELSNAQYTGIITVKGDNIVLGSNEGIVVLRVDSDRNAAVVSKMANVQNISTLKQVGRETFVAGTWDQGLFICDIDQGRLELEPMRDMGFQDVVDIFYDNIKDEIWVAGGENVAIYKRTPFVSLGETGRYRVEGFTYDQKGDLYFTTGEELYFQDGRTGEKSLLLTAEGYFFTTVCIYEQQLWVGDHLGHVYRYDQPTNTLMEAGRSAINFDLVNQIVGIDDKVWVAHGLSSVVTYGLSGGKTEVPGIIANVIKKSPDGDLFAGGTGRGNLLARYDKHINSFVPLDISADYHMSENIRVDDIAFDDSGIYLATNEGVLKVQSNAGKYYSNYRFLPGNGNPGYSFRALAYDGQYLWAGTNNGIFRLKEGEAVHYSSVNGLPSRLIKQRGFKFRRDTLTVATARGLVTLNNAAVEKSETPSPVVESFLVNNKSLSGGEEMMEIPHGANIEIGFRSLSYPQDDTEYQTRVIGSRNEHDLPVKGNLISLLGVSHGSHKFEIIAKNKGQDWSKPLLIEFVVLNPWYLRWWSVVLFLVLALAIVALAIRIYHYNLIRQKQKLKQLVREGTAEIEKQKNEIIDQQEHIIKQKQELLEKNEAVFNARQALTDADLKYLKLKESQLKDQVDYRNKQITTHTLNIIQKNETLQQLKEKLNDLIKIADKSAISELRKTIRYIDESFKRDKEWEDFKLYFEQIYTGFYAKLTAKCPELTSHDLRHCALIRLNLSIQECATILGISPESVKVSRARIRKKIKTDPGKGLSEFILSI